MKAKIYSIGCALAISALAMTSCSQQTDAPAAKTTTDTVIRFAVGNLTRAEDFDMQSLKDNGFVLSTEWNDGILYNNATAEFDGQNFTTVPTIYWPEATNTTPCTFYAVSWPGITGAPLHTVSGKTSFDYTCTANAADQIDVVVCTASASSIPNNGVLKMNFKHALTKVNFSLYIEDKPVNKSYLWKVSSIKIAAKDSGKYTFGASQPWSLGESTTDFNYMTDTDLIELQNNQRWDGNNNFMLIPQADKDLWVVVTWNVYLKNGDSLIKVSAKDATRGYRISTEAWEPGANLRYANLRLPNIGENEPKDPEDPTNPGDGGDQGGDDDGYDNNQMSQIIYDPSVTEW